MTLLRTACPLDCPDTCSITVDVVDDRLMSVDATPVFEAANPLTGGFICAKVRQHAQRVHGSDRVTTPLVRSGPKGSGTFIPVSWDEALDRIAISIRSAIDAHGPGSVVPYLYNSSAGVLGSRSIGHRVCADLGVANVEHTICAATMGAAKQQVLGGMLSADPLDIVHSRHIVVWGANPTVSNTHLPPLINTAVREHGARLVVVDPRRTAMAARAHRHLAVRPGTDVVLAAAMAHHLHTNDLLDDDFLERSAQGVDSFLDSCAQWTLRQAADITGVAAGDIVETAEEWAATDPSMLRMGWGTERNRNGGSGVSTVLALPVLMGKFGVRGAGILHSTGGGNPVGTDALMCGPTGTSSAPAPAGRRQLSQNRLGQALEATGTSGEAFVSVLIVQGANPALMNLDQVAVLHGLARDDLFTVVHDQVLTDTARYADVVLPATTHYESTDVADSYGSYVVQPMPAVMAPVGESRTNAAFWAGLGTRLGIEGITADSADPERMVAALQMDRPMGQARPSTVQMVDVHPGHSDGRFHLAPAVFVTEPAGPYPLKLLSPAGATTVNSMFGERRTQRPTVALHPGDAAARHISDGDTVRVHNHLAALELTAHVTADVAPGVVSIVKGFWTRAYGHPHGLGVNALIPAEVEPLAGGACFNDAMVEVSPVSSP